MGKTAGGYPYITVNAYNPWALIEQAGNGLAANGTWLPDIANPTTQGVPVTILGIPALYRRDRAAPGGHRARLRGRRPAR